MLKYLFVLLDKSANSFCYYRNSNLKTELIDLQLLKDVIFFAQKEDLIINFLKGKEALPEEYINLINTVNHIIISPNVSDINSEDDILIIDYTSIDWILELQIPNNTNVILRVEKEYLPNLASIIASYKTCKRLNIVLLEINSYSETEFEEYKKQLTEIKRIYIEESKKGIPVELSILSDRLMLDKMNNCDAGVTHITFAPNGKFYICPAFYFENEKESVGDLVNGLYHKNRQLFKLEYAPICRICDAYQCKRCVYTNSKTTLEVNTPSHEQCVVSHIERNCSKALLENNEFECPDWVVDDIIEIEYLDPFDRIVNK